MKEEKSKKDINWYISLITGIIAILAFFGIQKCNDILPNPIKNLEGFHKMTFVFEECNEPKFVRGELKAYYDISFSAQENRIIGKGFKHSETFEGKFMRYRKNFEIEVIGEVIGDELVSKIYEDNGRKTHKIEGNIRINLKTLEGKFNSNFYNCAGKLILKRE